VPLMQDGDEQPWHGNFAMWMPYQKGQAAKTEALEARLDRPTFVTGMTIKGEPLTGQTIPVPGAAPIEGEHPGDTKPDATT
jgi:hypothetical protein